MVILTWVFSVLRMTDQGGSGPGNFPIHREVIERGHRGREIDHPQFR